MAACAEETLFQMLARQAARLGGREAVADSASRLSYWELLSLAERLAGGLHGLGIRRGDSVLVQMSNCTDMAAVLFACWRIGAVAVLLLPAYREADIVPLSERIRPAAWIGEGRFLGTDYSRLASGVIEASPSIRWNICRQEGVPGTTCLKSLMEARPLAEAEAPHPLPGDVAAVICTGGTTGFPKPVPRTHSQLLQLSLACCRRCGLDETLVYLADLPLGHVFILAVPGLVGSLLMGGRTVFAATAATDEVFPLVEEERATMLTLVPSLLPIWLDAASWDPSDLSSLSLVEVGGAPVNGETLAKVAEAVDCRVQQAYGYSEGLVTLTPPLAWNEVGDMSVQGMPVHEGDELKIVRPDKSEAGIGEKGELISRGPYLCHGYYCAPELDGAFDSEGFFHSGDQAYWNGDGRICVCGRLKDLINRSGEKFSPMEIEAAVNRHPAVKDAVVVGVPAGDEGDLVCAWIQPSDAEGAPPVPDLADLRSYLLDEGVAAYKLPERLHVIGEMPKSAFGKILRRKLVEMS